MRAVLYCALFLFIAAACASVNAAPNETPAEPLANGAANFYYPSHAQMRVVLNPQNSHLKDIRVRRALLEVLASYRHYQVMLKGEFKPVDSLFDSTPFAFSKELDTPRSLAAIKPLLGDIEFLPLRESMIGGDLPGIPSFEMERTRLKAALAILKEAGFDWRGNQLIKTASAAPGAGEKSGAQFELEILFSTECAEAYWREDNCRRVEHVAIVFAEQLKKLGIKAPLVLMSSAHLAKRQADGDFSALVEYTQPHFTRKDLFDAASNTENHDGAELGDARPEAMLWRQALAGLPQAAISSLALALTDAKDFSALQDVTHAFDILARYNRTVIPIRSWKRVDEYVNRRLVGIHEALAASAMARAMSSFAEGKAAYDRKDYAEALRVWRPLAEQGNVRAQTNLGNMYLQGQGVSKDPEQAGVWFRRAADLGHASAQYFLGELYSMGEGVPADDAQAFTWLRRAAEQGHAEAQYSVGEMYLLGDGVAKDEAQAADWMRRAAEQGVARAQYNLGVMYHKGEGLAKDDAQAAAWLRRAAEQGLDRAQFSLGLHYANGWGVGKDEARAAAWYRRAADQGNEVAKAELAKLEAIVDSRTELIRQAREGDQGAITALHLHAQLGVAEAQFGLGALYADGKFVTKDANEAEKWFRKSAEQGHVGGQTFLATLLMEKGDGPQALDWYRRAAAQGDGFAIEQVKLLTNLGYGSAGSFEDGVAAYDRKDYAEALKIWRRMAEAGDASAQFIVGIMYWNGEGVKKDIAQSVNWYLRAARQGHGQAATNVCAESLDNRKLMTSRDAAAICYAAVVSGVKKPLIAFIVDFAPDAAFRRAMQEQLRDGGFYKGAVDGSFGPGTKRALEAAFNSKPAK
jgi:uncharacterized protein